MVANTRSRRRVGRRRKARPRFPEDDITGSDLPINLRTFDRPPSWVNREGKIDRSAMVEIRASQFWRRIPRESFIRRNESYPDRPGTLAAVGEYNITTDDVVELVNQQKGPGELAGDQRTRKSNVMKCRLAKGSRPYVPAPNPNRGGLRDKLIGLPVGRDPATGKLQWHQTLVIQRWRFPLERFVKSYHGLVRDYRVHHYFLCPGCAHDLQPYVPRWRDDWCPLTASLRKLAQLPDYDPYSPTALRIPRKHFKLFLPTCTEEEIYDAQFANSYIRDIIRPRNPNAPMSVIELALRKRYGVLFHPRRFRCRRCLDLRYGEARRTRKEP